MALSAEGRRLCDLCGERPYDPKFREISGWEQIRDQGGANKIIARKETSRRACSVCIGRLQMGVSLAQEQIV